MTARYQQPQKSYGAKRKDGESVAPARTRAERTYVRFDTATESLITTSGTDASHLLGVEFTIQPYKDISLHRCTFQGKGNTPVREYLGTPETLIDDYSSASDALGEKQTDGYLYFQVRVTAPKNELFSVTIKGAVVRSLVEQLFDELASAHNKQQCVMSTSRLKFLIEPYSFKKAGKQISGRTLNLVFQG